ncbi:PQQ-binding-like beta-propeller repeat protein [Streptomyces radicis]|uniref:Protein kinase domain-containing protein n=1 Tax=Streptomyces radicis TaxID=1750517 RepID=A0A3A9VSX8_9ACTN|nr:serine/threonine-protein kinase [Streptomyces radicis]RKN03889.1 hypothetical protein D7319_30025 [Streptomyces radicis]RKN14171.1 hypothetical protein D7318_30060 [Streptomyces radicis]
MGRYRIVSRLGSGGMGRVYLGRSPSGRGVAVKVVRPELADDADFRRRFAREVSAARRVTGFFTAAVVDADPDGSPPWLATAFVPGRSLEEAIRADGPWGERPVLALAAGLAEALEAIHGAGVIHRDLKPSNVLLADDGPRVIDFGISVAAEASALTRTGMMVGTPGFMSPEQLTGKPVGPASDVFSLGAVLGYTATGASPFGTGSAHALNFRAVYEEPELGELPPGLAVIRRCLAKDPGQRPSVDALLEELAAAIGDVDAEGDERTAVLRVVRGGVPPATAGHDHGAAAARAEQQRLLATALRALLLRRAAVQEQRRVAAAELRSLAVRRAAAAARTADAAPAPASVSARPHPQPQPQRPPTPPQRPTRRGALRTLLGAASVVAIGGGGALAWRAFAPEDGGEARAAGWDIAPGGALSPPAVAGETVYFGDAGGFIRAVNAATGEERWTFPTGGGVVEPVVAGGVVLVTGGNGTLYAIEAVSGVERWSFDLGNDAAPALVAEGDAYVSVLDSGVFAIGMESSRKHWTVTASGALAPTAAEGLIHVPTSEGLLALYPATGERRWTFGSAAAATPAASTGGVVCYATVAPDPFLHAVDASTGEERWSLRLDGETAISAPVAVDGAVYVGGSDAPLRALDAATGDVRWEHSPGAAAPPAAVDGTVLVPDTEGHLRALDADDGGPLWSFMGGDAPLSRPATGAAMAYVTSEDGHVYGVPLA